MVRHHRARGLDRAAAAAGVRARPRGADLRAGVRRGDHARLHPPGAPRECRSGGWRPPRWRRCWRRAAARGAGRRMCAAPTGSPSTPHGCWSRRGSPWTGSGSNASAEATACGGAPGPRGAGPSCALTLVRGSRSVGVARDDGRVGVPGRTRVYGWRWRRNPLRRRSDVVEAWTGLVLAVLLFVGAPLVGVVAARWADDEGAGDGSRAACRAASRPCGGRRRGRSRGAPGAGRQTVPVPRTGAVDGARGGVAHGDGAVPAGTRRGDAVDLWLDARGRTVAPPPGAAAVRQHSVAVGICATGVTAGIVLLARTALRRKVVQRRLGEWERAWARTGPEWTGRRA